MRGARKTLTLALGCLALAGLLPSTAAAAPAPAWSLSAVAEPSNFSAGRVGEYVLSATNVGAAPTDGTQIAIEFTMPAGVEFIKAEARDPDGLAKPTCAPPVGGVVTCQWSPRSSMSSAPASAATNMSSSSSADRSTCTIPLRSNCHDTAPGSANDPPLRLKMFLISAEVRLRLSESACTITATPLAA